MITIEPYESGTTSHGQPAYTLDRDGVNVQILVSIADKMTEDALWGRALGIAVGGAEGEDRENIWAGIWAERVAGTPATEPTNNDGETQ